MSSKTSIDFIHPSAVYRSRHKILILGIRSDMNMENDRLFVYSMISKSRHDPIEKSNSKNTSRKYSKNNFVQF